MLRDATHPAQMARPAPALHPVEDSGSQAKKVLGLGMAFQGLRDHLREAEDKGRSFLGARLNSVRHKLPTVPAPRDQGAAAATSTAGF